MSNTENLNVNNYNVSNWQYYNLSWLHTVAYVADSVVYSKQLYCRFQDHQPCNYRQISIAITH